MIGVLPNPKKSFQVEKPSTEIQQAVEHLTLFTKEYKLFKANPILNQYIFEASEFLSLGVYIEISCFTIAELRTEVIIEIKRKIGAFDQRHEISLANKHLTAITDLITESISISHTERLARLELIESNIKKATKNREEKIEENKRKEQEEKENNPFMYYTKQVVFLLLTIGLIGGFIFFVFSVMSCSKENSSSCGFYTNSNTNASQPTYKGSNGGCYYINSNGNKTYVDDKYCCN